jgi:two-component SAPR family response regulator
MRSKAFGKLTTVYRNLRVMKNISEKDEELFSYLETESDARETRTRKTKKHRKKNDITYKDVGFSMNRIAVLIFFYCYS